MLRTELLLKLLLWLLRARALAPINNKDIERKWKTKSWRINTCVHQPTTHKPNGFVDSVIYNNFFWLHFGYQHFDQNHFCPFDPLACLVFYNYSYTKFIDFIFFSSPIHQVKRNMANVHFIDSFQSIIIDLHSTAQRISVSFECQNRSIIGKSQNV